MDIRSTAIGASKSKTIYLGLAVTVIGYLQLNLAVLGPWVRPELLALANILLGLVVIIVRFVTSESLEAKGTP